MLRVRFGYYENSILDIDLYFNNVYENEWFADPLVKKMIKGVDNSDVVADELIKSPILGYIAPERLSGGVKALICMYKCDEFPIDLIVCGENCQRWICEISKIKDVEVTLSGYDLTFDGLDIHAICLNDNSEINSPKDWVLKMCEFVGGTADDR